MKKAIVIMLTGAMMLAAVACGGGSSNSTPAQESKTEEAKPAEETQETVESTVEEPEQTEPNISEDAMNFEDYMAAATDTEVVVQGSIQGKQNYFVKDDQGKASIYLQDQSLSGPARSKSSTLRRGCLLTAIISRKQRMSQLFWAQMILRPR